MLRSPVPRALLLAYHPMNAKPSRVGAGTMDLVPGATSTELVADPPTVPPLASQVRVTGFLGYIQHTFESHVGDIFQEPSASV